MDTSNDDEPAPTYHPKPWYWPTELGLHVLRQNETWIPESQAPDRTDSRTEARELAKKRHAASQDGNVVYADFGDQGA
jgi:hypothetical protein